MKASSSDFLRYSLIKSVKVCAQPAALVLVVTPRPSFAGAVAGYLARDGRKISVV